LPEAIAAPDQVHTAAAVAVLPGQLAWRALHGKSGVTKPSSPDSEPLATIGWDYAGPTWDNQYPG
jgi:hypothetical protein